MSGLRAYYLFEETHNNGSIKSVKRLDPSEIREYLSKIEGIAHLQVEFAMNITADNVGVPYILHKATEEGRLIWTANLTLMVEYWRK